MRTVNRIASGLLGLILLAGGLLMIVQTLTGAAGRPWPIPQAWRDTLGSTPFSDGWVLATSVIVGLVGLLALVAQLIPRRPERLPAEVDGNLWWVSRRSVERRSAQAAAAAGGPHHPKVQVRGDPHRWRVRLSGEASPHRHDVVEHSVREELSAIGAPEDVDITVSLRQKGRVA